MSSQINIYTANVTPKQKKELLGIYQHYLYFERGLELIFKHNDLDHLSYLFITRIGWDKESLSLPWKFMPTNKYELDSYAEFVSEGKAESNKYTYMSLYHTNTKNDVSYPKVNMFSNEFDFVNIDMELPCPVERYSAACPKNQKLKDAIFIIDGRFKVKYTGERFGDMLVTEALNDYNAQQEFRVLLNLADHYDKNKNNLSSDDVELMIDMAKVLKKIMATELLASFENKIIDLMGSYSDKAQEIMRTFFRNKNSKEIWQAAEKEHLIYSAEKMQHYLNIRHLMRHQWDTLDGTGRFAFDPKQKNDRIRKEYLDSYQLIFDKTTSERLKFYQEATRQMQCLLKIIYEEFFPRDKDESNSRFVQRLKEWQRQNPDKIPLVSTNYPLNSEKYTALIKNIRKIVPHAVLLDDIETNKLIEYKDIEKGYFHRAWFLQIYNHLESEMLAYCFTHGQLFNRNEMWQYFKDNVLTPQEYLIWNNYRELRNNLSHSYLSERLYEELEKAINGHFGEDVYNLSEFLRKNTPNFMRSEDGTYIAVHNDGSVIQIDMGKKEILSYRDKKGRSLLKKPSFHADGIISPVRFSCKDKEIIDCKLADGTCINLQKKKVSFADGTRFYFDAKKYNVFCFNNGNKIFMDKDFIVDRFIDKGSFLSIGRNETCIVASSHKIKTDNKGRISEDCNMALKEQNQTINFNYTTNGVATIMFPDETMLTTSKDCFTVTHNNIVLNHKNRFAFVKSYALLPDRQIQQIHIDIDR